MRAKLSLNVASTAAGFDAEASHDRERNKETQSDQLIGMYHEIWKKVRGNNAWTVDGRELDNSRLIGPVFDAHNEPRLTLMDQRSETERANDVTRNIEPTASILVRCLREDIDIYDIKFKEPETQRFFQDKKTKEAQLVAAREVLRLAIVREGLSAADIFSNPYAEMTICDVAISIADKRT